MKIKKIMFVCMGNICRSPLAHAYMKKLLASTPSLTHVQVDSSGIGAWHINNPSDERIIEVGVRHGLAMDHRAQQFTAEHGEEFNLIFAMDKQNYADILQIINPLHKNKVHLFRSFDTMQTGSCVADPYYGSGSGFEHCYETVARNCQLILQAMENGKLK